MIEPDPEDRFDLGNAVAAWLRLSVDELRDALEIAFREDRLQRARVGATKQYFEATGKPEHAAVLAGFLARLKAAREPIPQRRRRAI